MDHTPNDIASMRQLWRIAKLTLDGIEKQTSEPYWQHYKASAAGKILDRHFHQDTFEGVTYDKSTTEAFRAHERNRYNPDLKVGAMHQALTGARLVYLMVARPDDLSPDFVSAGLRRAEEALGLSIMLAEHDGANLVATVGEELNLDPDGWAIMLAFLRDGQCLHEAAAYGQLLSGTHA